MTFRFQPTSNSENPPNSAGVEVPSTAPGQYLGYSLQPTLLAMRLRQAPEGSACSIEVFDDVAELADDGTVHLTQSKSTLTGNPVSDRAESLWKTLYNWLELVKQGMVNPETTIFEIYVSQKVTGQVVELFCQATTNTAAAQALAFVRDLFWGAAPERVGRAELSLAMKKYANPVFEADESKIIPIIRNFRLTCSDTGSPISDFITIIASDPVSQHKVDFFVDKLLGWVKRQTDVMLEKGLPAVIKRDDFHREYETLARKYDRESILASFAPKPSPDQLYEHLGDTFIQQLSLIEEDYGEKLEAISDLLMAGWDRAKWSESGEVHESSFDELFESLQRTWRNLKKSNDITHAARPPIEQGKLLYYECKKYRATVQQMPVSADYFTPGCFHLLADVPYIGWHPQYATLLSHKHEEAL